MPTPTLLSMAQRACGRKIVDIDDLGGAGDELPYEILRPILKKIENPQKLLTLERASPRIADYSGELWRDFIRRDIPNWQTKMLEPSNPRSWWKVYRKLMREEQARKEASEETLRRMLQGENLKKEEHKTTFVEKVIPGGPKPKPKFIDGVPAPRGSDATTLRSAKTGQAVLSAIRKESSSAQRQKGFAKRTEIMRQPAKAMMTSAKSQITRAPKSMLIQHAPRPVPPPFKGPAPLNSNERVTFASKQPTAQDRALDAAVNADKERRLRALTAAKAGPPSPPKASNSNGGDYIPRTASPSNSNGVIRKRPAASAFIPAQKRKKVG